MQLTETICADSQGEEERALNGGVTGRRCVSLLAWSPATDSAMHREPGSIGSQSLNSLRLGALPLNSN